MFDDLHCGIVQLIPIDPVTLEALQAFIEDPAYVLGGEFSFAAIGSNHNIPAFGGENDFVPFSFERFAQQRFRIASAVGVRSIDKLTPSSIAVLIALKDSESSIGPKWPA